MNISFKGRGEGLEVFLDGRCLSLVRVKKVSLEEGGRLCAWMARQFPGMPGAEGTVVPLPELFLKPSFRRDRICFYGGSFDPWHRGHLACLELCPEENILVVPDCNPWKASIGKGRGWDYYLDICHILADTPYSVYPGLLHGGASPTVDWLPQTNFAHKSLLVGADNFLSLERWKNLPVLVESLDGLYVVPRGDNEYGEMTDRLKAINPRLEVVVLPRHPYEGLASSSGRK